jgi:hypothetical protein
VGVRTLLLLTKLLLSDLASPDEISAEGQVFLFLGHADKAAVDEHLLLDAVAIYTRDLGMALVQLPGKPPASVSPANIDEMAARLRAHGARLGFWCQVAPGGRQIELLTVDLRGAVTRHAFDPDAASKTDLYRSIALRLRAILVGSESSETAPSAPPASAPIVSTPATPVAAPVSRRVPEAPVTRPPAPPQTDRAEERAPPSGQRARSLAPRDWPRMFFGAGYALSYPLGTSAGAAARHALALDVTVATPGHLEWHFGTDLAPASDRTFAMATLSVLDVPLRFGGRWVHEAGPVTLAAGPFVALHWLSANASAGAQTDERTALGGAGGVDLLARGPSFAGFAPQLRVWAEVNVPRTRFTIQGVPNYDAGTLRLGLNLEIVAPVP